MDEQAIFAQALEYQDAASRATFLDRNCRNAAMRQNIERLLSVEQRVGDFMEQNVQPGLLPTDLTTDIECGSTIGAYRLIEKLGEGGMGVVFRAEQMGPLQRDVAIKLIRSSFNTQGMLARFDTERKTLALMDHSHIARVFDAGTTDSGHPYFVMELVDGKPITEFCDEMQLGIDDRLQLLIAVCQAVQYAHQKGIIHCDLKPSNVIVVEEDGKPIPKIIDFGVAQAIQSPATDTPTHSTTDALRGTPEYMSPEQASWNEDIDTRSDVYALGALLFELLIGTTPIDSTQIEPGDYGKLRRMVLTEVRPKPSQRLSSFEANEVANVAQARCESSASLIKKLRHDLDWIVMKAIQIERTLRYGTAQELAIDVERYLDKEPVLAHPPSTRYRLGKLMQRRRGTFAAISVIVAVSFAGLIFSTKGFLAATRSESRLISQLYASSMMSAFSAFAAGDMPRVSKLLGRYAPSQGGQDLRGFEWFHLRAQCEQVAHGPSVKHIAEIQTIALGDGYLLAAGGDHQISRFDLESRRRRVVDVGHRQQITCLALSPDGRTLATGSVDGTVRWGDPDELPLVNSRNIGVPVRTMALSSSDDTLVLGTASGGIELWKLSGETSGKHWTHQHGSGWVLATVLSADGELVATSSAYAGVKIWKTSTGELLHTLPGAPDWIWAISFSADGSTLAIAGWDEGVKLWDVSTPQNPTFRMQLRGNTRFVRALDFSPDGKTLAAAGHERLVSQWDAATGELISEQRGHAGLVAALAYSSDGRVLASGSVDSVVRLWDGATPKSPMKGIAAEFVSLVPVERNKFAVAFGGGGFGVTSRFGIYHATDVQDPTAVTQGIITCATTVPVSEEGASLISAAARQHEAGQWFTEIAKTKDGHDWTSIIADHPGRVFCIDVSPDGQTIATGTGEGVVQLWNASTGKSRIVARHARWVQTVVFSPDGQLLVSGGGEPDVSGSLVISDATTGDTLQTFDDFTEQVMDVVFLENGHSFAAASGDGTLRIYEVDDLQGEVIDRDTFMITTLAISPDGKTLAAGGPSGIVKLWHTQTREPLGSLEARLGLMRLAFSTRGEALVAAGTDGTVVVFHAPRGDSEFVHPPVASFSLVESEQER